MSLVKLAWNYKDVLRPLRSFEKHVFSKENPVSLAMKHPFNKKHFKMLIGDLKGAEREAKIVHYARNTSLKNSIETLSDSQPKNMIDKLKRIIPSKRKEIARTTNLKIDLKNRLGERRRQLQYARLSPESRGLRQKFNYFLKDEKIQKGLM